jgi:uncharacterized protein YdiU (UPF0061 family)
MTSTVLDNPLLNLDFVPALEALGEDYYDVVLAADFPHHELRFRNDDLLQQLGLDPATVSDRHFIEAFGQFQRREPLLALRYHGYQFGTYNPFLGDGRGFLYGQVQGQDGELYDFGTKGSGTTPYSRGGDGRLTLKGGVREVLAAEALHALGVRTSRTLSMVETGEQLWRGDEPSPTRSSVMVRFSRSHIRFGTFERLDYLDRTDLIHKLLEHVIDVYYPAARLCTDPAARYAQFYDELVERTAALAAQWMAVGFCHGVLNTDNMSITGESFDYGPYAWMDHYDPTFTAAYFDYGRRYCYRNQPVICRWNLAMLQRALKRVIPEETLNAALDKFDDHYQRHYQALMLKKLGFDTLAEGIGSELVEATIALLESVQVGYHEFFLALAQQFSPQWRTTAEDIFSTTLTASDAAAQPVLHQWRQHYHRCLQQQPPEAMAAVGDRLRTSNPVKVLLRPEIEAIWQPITEGNDWQPFYELLHQVQHPFMPQQQG